MYCTIETRIYMRALLAKLATTAKVLLAVALIVAGVYSYAWTLVTSHRQLSIMASYPAFFGAALLFAVIFDPVRKATVEMSDEASVASDA